MEALDPDEDVDGFVHKRRNPENSPLYGVALSLMDWARTDMKPVNAVGISVQHHQAGVVDKGWGGEKTMRKEAGGASDHGNLASRGVQFLYIFYDSRLFFIYIYTLFFSFLLSVLLSCFSLSFFLVLLYFCVSVHSFLPRCLSPFAVPNQFLLYRACIVSYSLVPCACTASLLLHASFFSAPHTLTSLPPLH